MVQTRTFLLPVTYDVTCQIVFFVGPLGNCVTRSYALSLVRYPQRAKPGFPPLAARHNMTYMC